MKNENFNSLIEQIKRWFHDRTLNHAVIGYSGGIDSATTAALLDAAEIPTTIVSINIENQIKSSNYDVFDFAKQYDFLTAIDMNLPMPIFRFDAGREAALPILRNACLYGVVAEYKIYKGFNPVTVGTANFDESSYLGFWGKASDAAQDFYPISHLHKSEVVQLAKYLKVPVEIINAVPSGDLQWSGELNDLKMIGCDYNTVEQIANMAKSNVKLDEIASVIIKMPDAKKFISNVLRNEFKYTLPFPNWHLSPLLEDFRRYAYKNVLEACKLTRIELFENKNPQFFSSHQ